MPNPDDLTLAEQLAVFADGELSGVDSQRAIDAIAKDKHAAQVVRQHLQLRGAVKRVMAARTPALPPALRTEIEQMVAAAEGPQPVVPVGSGYLMARGRWFPAAVAAMLLISAVAVFVSAPARDPATAGLLAVSQVEQFKLRHVGCTEGEDQLNGRELFPTDLQVLPERLAAYLGQRPTPSLDLSGLGYEFQAAVYGSR